MIRWRVLVALLVFAAAAIALAPSSKEAESLLVPLAARRGPAPQSLAEIPDLTRAPVSFDQAAGKLLPGEPPVKARLAGRPQPVLPDDVAVVGKANIDGAWKAIVTYRGKTHIVGAGERVDDRFVIDRIEPPMLVLIDLEQAKHAFTLSVGEAQ